MSGIFIIEDDMIQVTSLEDVLMTMGFPVCGFAPSGESALSYLEREKPAVILVDYRLRGELDGLQIATLVRREYGIPMIMITGNATPELERKAIESGIHVVLTKPIDFNRLKNYLQKFLNGGE